MNPVAGHALLIGEFHQKESREPRRLESPETLSLVDDILSDPVLGRIPVVVLMPSGAVEDILYFNIQDANCDITKPVDIESFFEVTRSIEDFWMCVVTLSHGAKRQS